jgi:hypothetical protein
MYLKALIAVLVLSASPVLSQDFRRDSSNSIGSSDNSVIYVNPGSLAPVIIRQPGDTWDYSTFTDGQGNTKTCTTWTSGVYQSVKCR